MKKIACLIVIFFFLFAMFLTTALCGDMGKTEQDKYLENGRFKVEIPGCDKSDPKCTDTSAYKKLQRKLKVQNEPKAKDCPSCVPAKENLSK
jgi:hypothetical protein